jgi:hypothetical protein
MLFEDSKNIIVKIIVVNQLVSMWKKWHKLVQYCIFLQRIGYQMSQKQRRSKTRTPTQRKCFNNENWKIWILESWQKFVW